MKLSQILSQVKTDYKIASGVTSDTIEIEDIALDSRLAKNNSAFFALAGKVKDGLEFIPSAIEKGASVVISNHDLCNLEAAKNALSITSSNPFALLTEFLQIFYSPLPANIYAITGTNGKTSTAEFTRQILQFLGKKSASIGTLGVMCDADIPDQLQNSSLTTPDLVSLYKNLSTLKRFSVDDVVIEVSSIGLEQKRIAGLEISVGAFTNFTQDHLDYHKTMAEYFRCKMILFDNVLSQGGSAIFNADIESAAEIRKICEQHSHKIIDYGFKARDLQLKEITTLDLGQRISFEFRQKNYSFDLLVGGDFQAMNALCALGNILAKNNLSEIELTNLLKNFNKLQPATGRMQRVATLSNKAQIFIDFAHTPDALTNVLELGRQITKSRLIILFGCGGDRDAGKRSIMGKIACEMADLVVVTDDNPRTEKPELIRKEILAACDIKKTIEISERKTAIEKAIAMLEAGDVLILAGKGHEKYQIIGNKKFEFDEEKIIKNVITRSS